MIMYRCLGYLCKIIARIKVAKNVRMVFQLVLRKSITYESIIYQKDFLSEKKQN